MNAAGCQIVLFLMCVLGYVSVNFCVLQALCTYFENNYLCILCYQTHIGRLARMSVLDTEVDGSTPGSSMLFP